MLSNSLIKTLSTKRLLAYKRKYFPSPTVPWFVEDWVFCCSCEDCKSQRKKIKEYKQNYIKIKAELHKRMYKTKKDV